MTEQSEFSAWKLLMGRPDKILPGKRYLEGIVTLGEKNIHKKSKINFPNGTEAIYCFWKQSHDVGFGSYSYSYWVEMRLSTMKEPILEEMRSISGPEERYEEFIGDTENIAWAAACFTIAYIKQGNFQLILPQEDYYETGLEFPEEFYPRWREVIRVIGD